MIVFLLAISLVQIFPQLSTELIHISTKILAKCANICLERGDFRHHLQKSRSFSSQICTVCDIFEGKGCYLRGTTDAHGKPTAVACMHIARGEPRRRGDFIKSTHVFVDGWKEGNAKKAELSAVSMTCQDEPCTVEIPVVDEVGVVGKKYDEGIFFYTTEGFFGVGFFECGKVFPIHRIVYTCDVEGSFATDEFNVFILEDADFGLFECLIDGMNIMKILVIAVDEDDPIGEFVDILIDELGSFAVLSFIVEEITCDDEE